MDENQKNELLLNIGRLHTTDLGVVRIKRNLDLDADYYAAGSGEGGASEQDYKTNC